ncbi:FMN-dependent dehydrogenase-domain-containing protein [Xylaria acuta]|nr:FMN-dependent dehydrogenase-domain-containing protein [Xylaria acuta]
MVVVDGAEVAKHNTDKDCWVVLNGKAIHRLKTGFLENHPGGANLICRYSGRDATGAYDEVHDPELITRTLSSDKCLGNVRPGRLPEPRQEVASTTATSVNPIYPHLGSVINVDDFEKVAKQYLTSTGWAYYAGGAEDEVSLMDTRRLFTMITFRPRILRRVDLVSTAVKIPGYPSSLPIYVSPTGQGRYAYRNAELVLACAAGKEGVLYCIPTTVAHESVFAARSRRNQPLFFQPHTTREQTKAQTMIRKLEALGASALFLTVDSPVLGRREKE